MFEFFSQFLYYSQYYILPVHKKQFYLYTTRKKKSGNNKQGIDF